MENILAVSNQTALKEMKLKGEELGFNAQIVTDKVTGEAGQVGKEVASQLREAPSKTLLLFGGETTVTKKGNGKGGRNQELTLSALENIEENELVISTASDGRDNGDYAGAIADSNTKEKGEKLKLDLNQFLNNNDSSSFFTKTEDFILTEPLGSNVSDLILALKG